MTFTAYTAEDSGFSGGATALFAGNQASVNVATNAFGVATAPTLTANGLTGSYLVTASTPGGYAPVSWTLTNTGQAPATIVAMPATTPQSEGYGGDNNFPSPLQARVLDASGNPVPNVTVTFTAPGSGPTIAFPGWITSETQATDANGIATSDSFCGVNSTGGFEVSAVAAGVASSAVFQLSNSAASPYSVTASASSTPQIALVSKQFATSLVVTITDSNNVPVDGVQVTFAAFTARESGNAGSATGTFAGSKQSVSEITGKRPGGRAGVHGERRHRQLRGDRMDGQRLSAGGVRAEQRCPDTTPPTTTVSGLYGVWTNRSVKLTFHATDNSGGSGVAFTQYSLDGGTTGPKQAR